MAPDARRGRASFAVLLTNFTLRPDRTARSGRMAHHRDRKTMRRLRWLLANLTRRALPDATSRNRT